MKGKLNRDGLYNLLAAVVAAGVNGVDLPTANKTVYTSWRDDVKTRRFTRVKQDDELAEKIVVDNYGRFRQKLEWKQGTDSWGAILFFGTWGAELMIYKNFKTLDTLDVGRFILNKYGLAD